MAFEVPISPMSTERFRAVLPEERYAAFDQAMWLARELLDGRVVWNINSTAHGGGVVELLGPLLAYARGIGVDARWLVIEGPPEFFAVTKRIHNRLHGTPGDGLPLDDQARRIYEDTLAANADAVVQRIRPGDVVIIHDPQPAGLLPAIRAQGASVIWRCHVGLDTPNELARETWAFLLPYLSDADAYVFSRESFAWDGLDRDRIVVIPPTIDIFSPKNQELSPDLVGHVLSAAGIVPGAGDPAGAVFKRQDGSPRRVERKAKLWQERPLEPDVPTVVQISRWDALKDPLGVIRGFAEHVPPDTGAHLLYAGPAVDAVQDDPEGARMLQESIEMYERLPPEARARIHLATLPMDDTEENAVMVNAIQRHSSVIVQKSLAEGFGLTVAEAMWKARPVVASRIGGIQDQIVDGETGVLLDDPRDLRAYGGAVTELLRDKARAEQLGEHARERVRERFISVRSLLDYFELVRRVLTGGPVYASVSRS
jgi:trehalose synthase